MVWSASVQSGKSGSSGSAEMSQRSSIGYEDTHSHPPAVPRPPVFRCSDKLLIRGIISSASCDPSARSLANQIRRLKRGSLSVRGGHHPTVSSLSPAGRYSHWRAEGTTDAIAMYNRQRQVTIIIAVTVVSIRVFRLQFWAADVFARSSTTREISYTVVCYYCCVTGIVGEDCPEISG